MVNKDNTRKRQAYIDNQLPVEEVIEFEKELDRHEKIELDKEMEFEKELSSHINKNIECPEYLWKDIQARVASQSKPQSRLLRWFPTSLRISMLVASVIFFLALGTIFLVKNSKNTFSIAFTKNLADFSKPALVAGSDETIRNDLVKHGFDLPLPTSSPLTNSQHEINILGVEYHSFQGKEYAQLYFSCCQQPMVAIVSRESLDEIAKHMQIRHSFDRFHRVYHRTGKYHILVMGPHPAEDIVKLISS